MSPKHSWGEAKPLYRRVGPFSRLFGGSSRRAPPSPEWLAKMDEVQSIAPSPLVGVVGVGATAVASEVTVDLIAIEIRARGAVVSWRARSDRELMLIAAEMSIADDRGTQYRVISGGASGASHAWEGQVLVAPPPPSGVHLTISLDSFGPQDYMPLPPHVTSERVVGPWRFEVDIPSRDTP